MTWKYRHSLLAILSAAYLLCYGARMVMASALPFIADEFHLSSLAMGTVLSAFFIGYSVLQIPGGLLADKFGPRRVLTAAIAGWSIFTAATGMAASLTELLVIRVLFGASEAAFPSAASKSLAIWFPRGELGRANGIMLSSTQLGAALAPPAVAILVISWGWRSAFYSLLIPGLILTLIIRVRIKDSPTQGSCVTGPELAAHDNSNTQRPSPKATIVASLKNTAVLWCFAAAFFSNLAAWGLMNWLPTYLLQVRHLSIGKMGVFASLPPIAAAAGYYLGGQISDRWFCQRRQVPVQLGLILSATLTYLAAIAATAAMAVAYLTAAFLCLSIADAGICTLPLVIVPQRAVGGAFGIVNTAAQLAGFLSPLLVGYLLDATASNFTLVFYCFVGFLIVAACGASRIRQMEG
jgi:sugar phosphate permease